MSSCEVKCLRKEEVETPEYCLAYPTVAIDKQDRQNRPEKIVYMNERLTESVVSSRRVIAASLSGSHAVSHRPIIV